MVISTRFTKGPGDAAPSREDDGRSRGLSDAQRRLAEAGDDGDAMFAAAAGVAMEHTGAEAGVVALVEGDELVYRGVSGTAAPYLGMRLDAASSLSGRCLATGQALRSDDAALTADPISIVCVPLPGDGDRPVGVLKATAKGGDAFDDADLAALSDVAAAVAAQRHRAAPPVA